MSGFHLTKLTKANGKEMEVLPSRQGEEETKFRNLTTERKGKDMEVLPLRQGEEETMHRSCTFKTRAEQITLK